ncbi:MULTISPECIES: hypothetical protein [unclassified Alteromonas]|uniref:hypothetical protein n=1 Tax=unclassified Alteromonas TaxID=2614992 RepID=UPI0005095D01|nr:MULTISPECIES: hypothetical protein [unclassified Alteromonas]
MNIKTTEDVDGIISLQRNKRIAQLEKEINRLNSVPAFLFFCMISYIGFVHFSGGELYSVGTSIFFAGMIAGTGQAAMKKADLLHELSELKSSERCT